MNKRTKRWVSVIAAIVLVVGGFWLLSRKPSAPAPGESADLQVSAEDWSTGPEDAPVTLVEYGDFQCGACAYYAGMVSQLAVDYPNDLRIVYRHFPLLEIHPLAVPAARAAEAAGKQDKFWEMADLLYLRQEDWTKAVNVREAFALYATQLELDQERFLNDYDNSDDADAKIREGISSGNSFGVAGTPSFFVNGARIENPRTYAEFAAIIEQARGQ